MQHILLFKGATSLKVLFLSFTEKLNLSTQEQLAATGTRGPPPVFLPVPFGHRALTAALT